MKTMNRITRIIEIPQECVYCKKKPAKLVSIKIVHWWKPNYYYDQFVCKDHIEKAELDARNEI